MESIFYFNPAFFWCSVFFKNISTSRFKPTTWQTLVLQDWPQRYILSYFFKLLLVLSLSTCWIFSNLYIPPCVGKNFQFMVFILLEKTAKNTVIWRDFLVTKCLFTKFPHQKIRWNYSIFCSEMDWIYAFLLMSQFPTQNSTQNFLKICFRQAERGGENYDLLYQNSIRKYEDDLEH